MAKGNSGIKVYTRQVDKRCYPEGLANSIHFSCSLNGGEFRPFNKNYGILFAEAEIRPDNTIYPKGIKDPGLVILDEGYYGIVGSRINENGDEDDTCIGKILLWKTKNFIDYDYIGLVPKEELKGKIISDTVEVDSDLCKTAIQYWNPICSTSVYVPDRIEVHSKQDMDCISATVTYSDGSIVNKKIAWDLEAINFSVPGEYEVSGRVISRKYKFPLAKGYGDPVIFYWDNKWYYISTNDNLDDIGLYVREADTVEELFDEDVVEHLILPLDESRQLVQTFWAPEFHVIGGELYILFAVSGNIWGPQCHMMKLKKGCSIIEADSWENPVRIKRKNGDWLAQDGITLDMTYFKAAEKSYVVWSYRENIGTPMDTGSMLYIATIDEKEPWVLTSEPVLLSRPLYGWENVEGTINNEGPYAFLKNDVVYLTYSGGAANGYTYALGLLTAKIEDDLLKKSSWFKRSTPVLSFYSVKGEYGPGHNSFYKSEDNDLMIAYHAEMAIDEHLRCDAIRRVHFRKDGTPDFAISAEADFDDSLINISTRISIS